MGAHGVAEPLAELDREVPPPSARTSRSGPGPGARSARSASSPSQVRRWPAGSLRACSKIVSGAGIELKARNASRASGSRSRENPGCRSSAFSSEPKERIRSAIR